MKRVPLKSRIRRAIYSATVLAFYRRLLTQFERQAASGQTLQNNALLTWIDRCRGTDFGKRHSFGQMSNIDDFRRSVPISNYEDLRPDFSAVAEGNTNALLPADEKLHAFARTSGSSGRPKIFPVTGTWLRQYQKQWRIWGAKAVSDNTMLTTKKWLQISGPLNIDRTASDHQVGMVSAITAHHQNPLLRSFFATPPHFSDVLDPQIRSYLILRLAMSAEHWFHHYDDRDKPHQTGAGWKRSQRVAYPGFLRRHVQFRSCRHLARCAGILAAPAAKIETPRP